MDAGGDTHALVGLVTYLIDLGLLSVVIELSVSITDEFNSSPRAKNSISCLASVVKLLFLFGLTVVTLCPTTRRIIPYR